MILMKFVSNGCEKCPAVTKVIDDVSERTGVPVENYSMSSLEDFSTFEKYGVRGAPSTILVNDNGEVVSRWYGLVTIKEIEEVIRG